MRRRSFLALLGLAPFAVKALPKSDPVPVATFDGTFLRLRCERPGEWIYEFPVAAIDAEGRISPFKTITGGF